MKSTRSRRKFVGLLALGAVGLSGCTEDDDPPDDDPDDDETVPDDEDEPDDDPGDEDNDQPDDEDEPDNDTADGEDEPDDDEEEYSIEDQPGGASASFVSPEDGDTVESPVQIEGEAEGVELVPLDNPAEGEGHLHVIVDNECFDEGTIIPGPDEESQEEGIFHWGDGQSEDEIELEPGEYDLCIQLGDGLHTAFGETDEITITVEE